MRSASKSILVTSEFIVISVLATLPIQSQSPATADLQGGARDLGGCRDAAKTPSSPQKEYGISRWFLKSEGRNASRACEEPLAKESLAESRHLGHSWADAAAPIIRSRTAPMPAVKADPRLQPVGGPALTDVGEEGTNISHAREAVLEILQGTNACSDWFRQTDIEVSSTFLTLHYSVDEDGDSHVIKERSDRGNWIEHGPYIARTWQQAGPGTTITINGKGAFFRKRGDVYQIAWPGSIGVSASKWTLIHIGPYDGGTLKAQLTVLLHELAHVIGAIPEDDSSRFGPNKSQENTALILQHCKREIDSAGKHAAFDSVRASVN